MAEPTSGFSVSDRQKTENPIVVIDNYDSFTYNLCQDLEICGHCSTFGITGYTNTTCREDTQKGSDVLDCAPLLSVNASLRGVWASPRPSSMPTELVTTQGR